MIYVIQEYTNNTWENVRHPDGMPMMFTNRKAANVARVALPAGRWFRVELIRD